VIANLDFFQPEIQTFSTESTKSGQSAMTAMKLGALWLPIKFERSPPIAPATPMDFATVPAPC
jgi:hypothetical protein